LSAFYIEDTLRFFRNRVLRQENPQINI